MEMVLFNISLDLSDFLILPFLIYFLLRALGEFFEIYLTLVKIYKRLVGVKKKLFFKARLFLVRRSESSRLNFILSSSKKDEVKRNSKAHSYDAEIEIVEDLKEVKSSTFEEENTILFRVSSESDENSIRTLILYYARSYFSYLKKYFSPDFATALDYFGITRSLEAYGCDSTLSHFRREVFESEKEDIKDFYFMLKQLDSVNLFNFFFIQALSRLNKINYPETDSLKEEIEDFLGWLADDDKRIEESFELEGSGRYVFGYVKSSNKPLGVHKTRTKRNFTENDFTDVILGGWMNNIEDVEEVASSVCDILEDVEIKDEFEGLGLGNEGDVIKAKWIWLTDTTKNPPKQASI